LPEKQFFLLVLFFAEGVDKNPIMRYNINVKLNKKQKQNLPL